jgi:hypothetical protein
MRTFLQCVEQVSLRRRTLAAGRSSGTPCNRACSLLARGRRWELIEIAPSVDLETQRLARMAFRSVLRDPQPVPACTFKDGGRE